MPSPDELIATCDVSGRPCSMEQSVGLGIGVGCLCEACSTFRAFNAPTLRPAPPVTASWLDKVMKWPV